LSHLCRGDKDLSAKVEPAMCLQLHMQCSECTHFHWLHKSLISNPSSLKYTNIRMQACDTAFITTILPNVLSKKIE